MPGKIGVLYALAVLATLCSAGNAANIDPALVGGWFCNGTDNDGKEIKYAIQANDTGTLDEEWEFDGHHFVGSGNWSTTDNIVRMETQGRVCTGENCKDIAPRVDKYAYGRDNNGVMHIAEMTCQSRSMAQTPQSAAPQRQPSFWENLGNALQAFGQAADAFNQANRGNGQDWSDNGGSDNYGEDYADQSQMRRAYEADKRNEMAAASDKSKRLARANVVRSQIALWERNKASQEKSKSFTSNPAYIARYNQMIMHADDEIRRLRAQLAELEQ